MKYLVRHSLYKLPSLGLRLVQLKEGVGKAFNSLRKFLARYLMFDFLPLNVSIHNDSTSSFSSRWPMKHQPVLYFHTGESEDVKERKYTETIEALIDALTSNPMMEARTENISLFLPLEFR